MDLLNRVDTPVDMTELDEIIDSFDLGEALSTSLGVSPVATDLIAQSGHPAQPILTPSTGQTVQTDQMASNGQSGHLASTVQMISAQPILTMLMSLMSQTVPTSSTTQSTPMVPVAPLPQTISTPQMVQTTTQMMPMVQVTPLPQMVSPTLLAPTLQSASTSQPIPTAQAIPQVLVGQSAQTCSQLAEATFQDIDDMVNGIGREEAAEKTKNDESEREILRLRGVLTQLKHRNLVRKGAKVGKMQASQSKLKRPVCFSNDMI